MSASGWYDDGQHGGVVSALMTRAIELVPVLTPMALARVTVDLFRVVPVALLTVSSEVIRQGKKIQVVKASLSAESCSTMRARLVARCKRCFLIAESSFEVAPVRFGGVALNVVRFVLEQV